MLRLLVAALLVANLLFWAWHYPPAAQALGLSGAEAGREPERLQRQVNPQAIRLLAPGASAPRAAASAAGGESPAASGPAGTGPTRAAALCLEAGPLSDSAAGAAARELAQAGVPAGAWVDVRRELPGRWILYMGRFADREALQKKLDELQRLSLAPTEMKSPPDLAPGLALGEFGAQVDAQARLAQLQARGVRTARVLQLPSAAEHRLRVDKVEGVPAERLAALGNQAGTTRWQTCAAP